MNEAAILSRTLIAFLVVDLALGLFLGYRLLAPRPVAIVPGVRTEQVAVPGAVPERTAANFALLFALNFENYSTGTLEAQDRFAVALVSPRFIKAFEKMTAERRQVIREAQMASSLFPDLKTLKAQANEDGHLVTFRARKQHVVGERLSWEASFEYRVIIERAFPTHANPYGLAVAGFQAAKTEESNAR